MVPKCVHVVIKGFRIILPTNSLKCKVLCCDWGKHNKDNQWTNYKWSGSVSWCGPALQIHNRCTDAYIPSLHTVDEILIRNGSMSSLIQSQVSSSGPMSEAETSDCSARWAESPPLVALWDSLQSSDKWNHFSQIHVFIFIRTHLANQHIMLPYWSLARRSLINTWPSEMHVLNTN